MILEECGRAFDPDVVAAFTKVEEKIVTLREQLSDGAVGDSTLGQGPL